MTPQRTTLPDFECAILTSSAAFDAPAPSAPGVAPVAAPLLPLWLTTAEAEAILTLCAAAPACLEDQLEHVVFTKLGELLRAFSAWGALSA